MDDMLEAAGHFLGRLPVNRYTFLYHFEDKSAGAWEHSLSSEYVFQESEFTDSLGRYLTDIAAHEFFHVVTPLNIHSEIIEHFNFVTPVPSQHLWLYEGTTEWAAHVMQLRAGLKSPEDYLAKMLQKIQIDRAAFDSSYSLRELALTSYSDSGQKQYGNIYMRGALTAGLLDIRLLELSNGERGLQDVILELTRKFGKTAGVSRERAGGYAGGDDLPRGAGLLRPLRLGVGEAADQGVLRQARHPPGGGRRRTPGAVRDRSQPDSRSSGG